MNSKKIVLITGATSGIGRHAASYLADKGYRVFASGRNEEALADLARECPRLETVRLDVTDPASIEAARAAIDDATAGHGVDVLVNNAGYGTVGPAEQCTDEDLRRQYDVNVFGLMAVTRAFLPRMRERGAGRVLNVSSVGGQITFPFMGVYNSTKYAVESLTDALRMELQPFGVHFVLIEPGAIATGFADRSMDELERYRDPSSPWAPLIERADEVRALADKTAAGPLVISRAIERAIRARRPAARYMAPLSAKLMVGAVRRLPTPVTDWMMRRLLGLSRKQLGLADTPRRPLIAATECEPR